jgi:poly-gamma-glutamate synthesis protein (capsule biosynthesis protein)
VLDERGIPHTGSFDSEAERKPAYYFEVGGKKFALIAYTYTTNKRPESAAVEASINYLRPYDVSAYTPEIRKRMNTWVDRRFRFIKEEKRCIIRKLVGLEQVIERADDNLDKEASEPYIARFCADIKEAKQNADFVICYPHVGGQFNLTPGKFSEYVFERGIEAGADAILASHSHVIQKLEMRDGIPCAFSMGNFNMSPSSTIVKKENLPGFGLAVHLYFDDDKLSRVTFSILKAVEKRNKSFVTWPVDELYAALKSEKEKAALRAEVARVYGFVTGKTPREENIIQREYDL